MPNDTITAATEAVSKGTSDAVSAATQAAAVPPSWLDQLFYFIMVPLVYLSLLALVVGLVVRLIAIWRAPRQTSTLRLFPAARKPLLAALGDTFLMPQIRRHKPVFWFFLMLYHVAFLLLILGHLDLFPGINLMPPESRHMLGWGGVGLLVTCSLVYLLLRRFRSPERQISVPADYLLLLLLLFIFLLGDTISWANSWSRAGFVMTKQDFARYFGILASFSFADPRTVLHGSHYHFVVLHVFLANLFFVILPFSKVVHTFFALPINILRRRS